MLGCYNGDCMTWGWAAALDGDPLTWLRTGSSSVSDMVVMFGLVSPSSTIAEVHVTLPMVRTRGAGGWMNDLAVHVRAGGGDWSSMCDPPSPITALLSLSSARTPPLRPASCLWTWWTAWAGSWRRALPGCSG
jgi:hypothetical protein